jgi:hypothetical protein
MCLCYACGHRPNCKASCPMRRSPRTVMSCPMIPGFPRVSKRIFRNCQDHAASVSSRDLKSDVYSRGTRFEYRSIHRLKQDFSRLLQQSYGYPGKISLDTPVNERYLTVTSTKSGISRESISRYTG